MNNNEFGGEIFAELDIVTSFDSNSVPSRLAANYSLYIVGKAAGVVHLD